MFASGEEVTRQNARLTATQDAFHQQPSLNNATTLKRNITAVEKPEESPVPPKRANLGDSAGGTQTPPPPNLPTHFTLTPEEATEMGLGSQARLSKQEIYLNFEHHSDRDSYQATSINQLQRLVKKAAAFLSKPESLKTATNNMNVEIDKINTHIRNNAMLHIHRIAVESKRLTDMQFLRLESLRTFVAATRTTLDLLEPFRVDLSACANVVKVYKAEVIAYFASFGWFIVEY